MKQRLLLSLLMLFVSVGFAIGQNTQYIIDVTFPANATTGSVTATVTYVNEKGDDVTAKVTINVTAATK